MIRGLKWRALRCETQSVFAKDPPTHHHMAQTDRVSHSTLLTQYLTILCQGNREACDNQIEVSKFLQDLIK